MQLSFISFYKDWSLELISSFILTRLIHTIEKNSNKATLGDLIAATGLVILLNLDLKKIIFFARMTLKFVFFYARHALCIIP